MPYLIVEYDYDPPITDEQLMANSIALQPCLQVRNVKRLRSWTAVDRTKGCCEYYAPDTETLREAFRSAQVKFARVWPAMLFEGETPPDTWPGAS
jgi:hypothetical protein